MKSAATWDSDTELYVTLLNTPDHIQAKICEYESTYKPCISFLKYYQELAKPWYQRPVACEFFSNVSENAKLLYTYICMIHKMLVMKNIIPKISLRTGITGLVSASCSYILKI